MSEHVHGTRGNADVGAGRLLTASGQEIWKYGGPGVDPYQREHDVLFDAIRNNKEHNEAEYGATSTMTSILGRMCTYSGQEITWDQAIGSNLSLMPSEFSFDAKPVSVPGPDGRRRFHLLFMQQGTVPPGDFEEALLADMKP